MMIGGVTLSYGLQCKQPPSWFILTELQNKIRDEKMIYLWHEMNIRKVLNRRNRFIMILQSSLCKKNGIF